MPGVQERVETYYRSLLDQLSSGDRLPSERSVMAELDTCRSTIRLILTKLTAEKRLYPIHGRGYFKS
jgi:DNA-binding GntR family transcriptional regulator